MASSTEDLTAPLLVQDAAADGDAVIDAPPCLEDSKLEERRRPRHNANFGQTVITLLSLQLGWGLWLLPADFARLGWLPTAGCLLALWLLTTYSGALFHRLYELVPDTVLLADIGEAASGKKGRLVVTAVVCILDGTRCAILHLAATQSLQHAISETEPPPLWRCVVVVAIIAAVLVQVRSLSELSFFLGAGTCAQLVAVAIVLGKLLATPDASAHTALVGPPAPLHITIAVMNLIFAYGGQFAYVEIMSSMKAPRYFPRAVTGCVGMMTCVYVGLGAVGYWSRGDTLHDIVIFCLGKDWLSRVAAAMILLQALAQYLVNLNVWTHNLLTLCCRAMGRSAGVRCSADHARPAWLLASTFVVAYSGVVAATLPFFSALVGLVTSATYLVVAYTLPAYFLLCLAGDTLSTAVRFVLAASIPITLAMSAVGLYASFYALVTQAGGSSEGPA